jgi:phosphoglycolate phosphatase
LFSAYFFDIDGTILDSAPDICGAILAACGQNGMPDVSEAQVRRHIGRSLVSTFSDFYPGISQPDLDRLCAIYREHYQRRAHANTRVFPGVAEMLAQLPGLKSTATTKGTATTNLVLDLFGLRQYFHHVQGSDNGRYKPDPTILLEAAEVLRVRPEACLMVGDTPVDIEAGQRAGMRTCAVAWGYGDHAELRKLQPDLWIETPAELLSVSS